MKKYELSLNFLKNNFNYKNFCEDLDFAYEKNYKDYPIKDDEEIKQLEKMFK